MDQTIRLAARVGVLRRGANLAALDSSGFEAHHVSHYFVRRRAAGEKTRKTMTYRRFPKMGLLVDCSSHLILAVVPGRGPGPDHKHAVEAMTQACHRHPIDTVLADAGYDSERFHSFTRGELGVCALIPPRSGRPTEKPPSSRFRRQMHTYFRRPPQRRRYGQRWQVETVFSMIKRRLGDTLAARSPRRQNRALILKALTHNVLILLLQRLFYTATSTRIPIVSREAP